MARVLTSKLPRQPALENYRQLKNKVVYLVPNLEGIFKSGTQTAYDTQEVMICALAHKAEVVIKRFEYSPGALRLLFKLIFGVY